MKRSRPPMGKPPLKPGRPNGLTTLLLISLVVTAFVLMFFPADGTNKASSVPISTITQQYNNLELEKIEVRGNEIIATRKDGDKLKAFKPESDSLRDIELMDSNNPTTIDVSNIEADRFWMGLLQGILPVIIIGAIIIFMLRQAQGNANSALSFGKSRARLHDKAKNKTTFKDVAGADESKAELEEIVDFLKHPKKYTNMGAKIPRGVLLYGPPGTGKTLLARAVAGEADVPFFSISGSEFVEMFVGVGASRVRDLFKKAKRNAPAIIFIDEIDAVGRQRGTGVGGGHDEREQTLNQILTEMDGFENDTSVIVMASTNRPDVLDPALLRPGRFDRRVILDSPNLRDRLAILKVHAAKKPLAKNVDLEEVARHTPGFSGADLENLLNEAAILAAKHDLKEIPHTHVIESIEKVLMGPTKKSRVLTEEETKITAYHETGHAIVGYLLPHCDPLHKISIVSRGMALGVTWFMPKEDSHLKSRAQFEDELASLFGGRVAEEIVFGENMITTGASNDMEKASNIARKMVQVYGMSPSVGPVNYNDSHGNVFLGKDMMSHKNYSEAKQAEIDAEVHRIINTAYKVAKDLLTKHRDALERVSLVLLERELLSREEFIQVFEGKELPPLKLEVKETDTKKSKKKSSKAKKKTDEEK